MQLLGSYSTIESTQLTGCWKLSPISLFDVMESIFYILSNDFQKKYSKGCFFLFLYHLIAIYFLTAVKRILNVVSPSLYFSSFPFNVLHLHILYSIKSLQHKYNLMSHHYDCMFGFKLFVKSIQTVEFKQRVTHSQGEV